MQKLQDRLHVFVISTYIRLNCILFSFKNSSLIIAYSSSVYTCPVSINADRHPLYMPDIPFPPAGVAFRSFLCTLFLLLFARIPFILFLAKSICCRVILIWYSFSVFSAISFLHGICFHKSETADPLLLYPCTIFIFPIPFLQLPFSSHLLFLLPLVSKSFISSFIA